ncbi:hypothetical protein ABPG75_013551 [Micractinium tetrahymenae]
MAMLARGSGGRHCPPLLAAARRLSGSPATQLADKGMRDAQDPSKTWPAYSHGEDRAKDSAPSSQGVPREEDTGTEREVKWGQNIPASAEQAKEELKFAGKGLAESVEQAAGVLLSKAKDAVAGAQRAMGMETDRPEMSAGTMGAAGKMEHAPPGVKSGGPAGSRENAEAKYGEISDTEKPHFPAGERTVQEMYPDMGTAASEQSNTPDQQRAENERIRRELRGPGAGAGGSTAGTPGMEASSSEDTLYENLHNKGP